MYKTWSSSSLLSSEWVQVVRPFKNTFHCCWLFVVTNFIVRLQLYVRRSKEKELNLNNNNNTMMTMKKKIVWRGEKNWNSSSDVWNFYSRNKYFHVAMFLFVFRAHRLGSKNICNILQNIFNLSQVVNLNSLMSADDEIQSSRVNRTANGQMKTIGRLQYTTLVCVVCFL